MLVSLVLRVIAPLRMMMSSTPFAVVIARRRPIGHLGFGLRRAKGGAEFRTRAKFDY